MIRRTVASTMIAAALSTVGAFAVTPAYAERGHDHDRDRHRVGTYLLTGDPVDAANPAGSKFEGIGADERRGRFYVSEVTGGEIHRGRVGTAQTREWIAGHGTDGRFTARGITVDRLGRVYIAGGPNGIGEGGVDNGRPDLWVYSPDGTLLAALQTPGEDAFLNDVAIGPDGAAYFTNSNDPQIFRVALSRKGWGVELWADASDTIARQTGFNLGGIVVSADRSALVVAQGNTGQLWRFSLRTGRATLIRTENADLVNADGLVRQGHRLTVVRNFSRQIATLRLSADGRRAELIGQRATSPDRVLTTAKALRGQILYVDSKFDEPIAAGPYEVITDPTR